MKREFDWRPAVSAVVLAFIQAILLLSWANRPPDWHFWAVLIIAPFQGMLLLLSLANTREEGRGSDDRPIEESNGEGLVDAITRIQQENARKESEE